MKFLVILVTCIFSHFAVANTPKHNCNDLAFARNKLNIAALNFVNAKTTRTHTGSFYKRKLLHGCFKGKCNIIETDSHKTVFEPTHPDADAKGNVKYPAISTKDEYFAVNSAVKTLSDLAGNKICNTRITFKDHNLIVIELDDHSSNYFKILGDRVYSWTATNSNGGNTIQFLN